MKCIIDLRTPALFIRAYPFDSSHIQYHPDHGTLTLTFPSTVRMAYSFQTSRHCTMVYYYMSPEGIKYAPLPYSIVVEKQTSVVMYIQHKDIIIEFEVDLKSTL
jgi:hypothetical protein